MKREFIEIICCLKRVVAILSTQQRTRLLAALFLMVIAGGLTNVPPVVLGRLLDRFVHTGTFALAQAWTFLAAIMGAILLRETIQVLRKTRH